MRSSGLRNGFLLVLGALFAGAASGCGGCRPDDGVVRVSAEEARVDGLFFGFRGQGADAGLDPETAFKVRAVCPHITEASWAAGKDRFGVLTLRGEHLDRVRLMAAVYDDAVSHARPHLEEDGSAQFATGCRDCALYFGLQVEGTLVACRGPGYSLRLDGGVLRAGDAR